MLQQLKKFSAQQKLNGFFQEHRSNSERRNPQIGAIFDLDLLPQNIDLAFFRKKLEVENENFHFLVCGKNSFRAEKYSSKILNESKLGWNGVFKTDSKEWFFQQTEFDLFLNYFTEPSTELLILSASVKANLKAGFPLKENRLNDLEIATNPNDHQLFAQELKKYLKIK